MKLQLSLHIDNEVEEKLVRRLIEGDKMTMKCIFIW